MTRARTLLAGTGFAAVAFSLVTMAVVILHPAPGHSAPLPKMTPAAEPAATSELPALLVRDSTPDQRGVPESALRITNETPQSLITGTLEAIAREDKAWLARTLASLAGHDMLTEVDLHSANGKFLTRSASPIWRAVERAWREQMFTVSEATESAELAFQVGGNLGELKLVLVRVSGAWFYAGS